MNKIKELFQVYIEAEDYIEELEKDIYKLASENKEEFKNLINLFEKENKCDSLLTLADILFDLGYKNLISSLKQCIKSTDVHNQYHAAILYIKCENPLGIEVIKHYVNHPISIPPHWILGDLEEIDNEMGRKLYKEVYGTCMKNGEEIRKLQREGKTNFEFYQKKESYIFEDPK